jgi:hypothetical protein
VLRVLIAGDVPAAAAALGVKAVPHAAAQTEIVQSGSTHGSRKRNAPAISVSQSRVQTAR